MTHFLTNIFYANECFIEPSSIEKLAQYTLTSTNLAGYKGEVSQPLASPGVPKSSINPQLLHKAQESVAFAETIRKEIDNTFPVVQRNESGECLLPSPTIGAIDKKILNPEGVWTSPNSDDTLFWCVYLASQGDTSRLTPKVVAKEKASVIDHIRAFPKCLKMSSEKTPLVSTNDILFDLLTKPATSPSSLVALCIYYKIRVMMVHFVGDAAVYAEVDPASEGSNFPMFIIKISPSTGKYSVDLDSTEEKMSLIRETGIRMDAISRPLKSASNYKVSELASMAARVGLVFEKKVAKAAMYEELASRCKWPVAGAKLRN